MRVFAVCLLVALTALSVFGESPILPPDYPQSLERELAALLEVRLQKSADPNFLLTLAGTYFDMGNDLLTDNEKRIEAYEEAARVAQHALELKEADAEAHFVYAAALGKAAELRGVTASLLSLEEMRLHVTRALELQKDHVPSIHMAGMMLEELPRFLGGNPEAALDYLERAVTLDPTYTHARLDLAKMYLKRKKPALAKRELLAIVNMDRPRHPYAWAKEYRPEAERLLESLNHAQ
jgi:tetratricopeptide (TPR) repeat protein